MCVDMVEIFISSLSLGQVVGFIDNCVYFSPSYIDSAFSSDLFLYT